MITQLDSIKRTSIAIVCAVALSSASVANANGYRSHHGNRYHHGDGHHGWHHNDNHDGLYYGLAFLLGTMIGGSSQHNHDQQPPPAAAYAPPPPAVAAAPPQDYQPQQRCYVDQYTGEQYCEAIDDGDDYDESDATQVVSGQDDVAGDQGHFDNDNDYYQQNGNSGH